MCCRSLDRLSRRRFRSSLLLARSKLISDRFDYVVLHVLLPLCILQAQYINALQDFLLDLGEVCFMLSEHTFDSGFVLLLTYLYVINTILKDHHLILDSFDSYKVNDKLYTYDINNYILL